MLLAYDLVKVSTNFVFITCFDSIYFFTIIWVEQVQMFPICSFKKKNSCKVQFSVAPSSFHQLNMLVLSFVQSLKKIKQLCTNLKMPKINLNFLIIISILQQINTFAVKFNQKVQNLKQQFQFICWAPISLLAASPRFAIPNVFNNKSIRTNW